MVSKKVDTRKKRYGSHGAVIFSKLDRANANKPILTVSWPTMTTPGSGAN